MTAEAEALVVAHLELVSRIAKSVAKCMPAWIEMEDLIGAGNLGLVQAASRYRPELHPSFPCYAYKLIRGRMFDAHRGRNYPRLTEALPEDFDCIDPALGPEQLLLAKERESDLRVDAWFAERRLTLVERRVVKRHVAGEPMRSIAAREGYSAKWAHYTIHRAKRKLRDNLREYEPRPKAA